MSAAPRCWLCGSHEHLLLRSPDDDALEIRCMNSEYQRSGGGIIRGCYALYARIDDGRIIVWPNGEPPAVSQ